MGRIKLPVHFYLYQVSLQISLASNIRRRMQLPVHPTALKFASFSHDTKRSRQSQTEARLFTPTGAQNTK